MSAALQNLSDEQLKAIADGKMDSLPDAVLQTIAGGESAPVAPQPAPAKTSVAPQGSTWNRDFPVPTPFGPMTVNPVQLGHTVKNLGLEGGGATGGQLLGASTGPLAPAAVPILGAIGGAGGNALGQLTTPGKEFKFGEMLAAGAAGSVPGASLAKAGTKAVLGRAAAYGGANLAANSIRVAADEGRLPTEQTPLEIGAPLVGGALSAPLSKYVDRGLRAEATRVAASQDSLRRETLNAGRGLGLVVPPAVTAPNAVNNTLQSMAGKAATAQEAILRNQPKVNAAVRAEIGLPMDAPITPISLNTSRVAPNLVYDEVAKLTPAAGPLLENFKTATMEANRARQAYRASIDAGRRNTALLDEAIAQDTVADQMRAALDKEAKSAGANTRNAADIMQRFDSARTKLAQIGLAERAANKGSGDIDAKVIGDALEHGEKLTGNFAKLGKFQNAFGKYVQDAANTPPSGVDYLKLLGKFGVGTGVGYAMGGYPGAVIGGVGTQLAEKGSRNLILSPSYQRGFASPFYGSTNEDIAAGFARYAAMSKSREKKK